MAVAQIMGLLALSTRRHSDEFGAARPSRKIPVKRSLVPNFDKFAPAQIAFWPHLAPIARHGFVLYGGMGLSTRLGHRGSLDFNFFASHPINRAGLAEDLPFLATAETLQNERNTYTVSMPVGSDDVKISFFGALGIKRVGEPELTDDGVCMVASINDLAATKLSVVLARIQASDYRDVLAIVHAGLALEEAIADTVAIYGNTFQPADILKALVYFEKGDLDELTAEERDELRAMVAGVREVPHRTAVARELSTMEATPPRTQKPFAPDENERTESRKRNGKDDRPR